MPRNLYPSHTGRFGGLNRQLMYARGRTRDFRDRFQNYPTMPEGVAGEEFHPEEYKSSPMWADVEQRLHEILRNPPKIHEDPQTDAERQSNYEAMFANNPQLIQEQMRGETMRDVAGGKSEEQLERQNEKKFKIAGTMAEGRHKVYMDMKKVNASNPDTYTTNEIDTALESRNAAFREWHKVAKEAGWGDISESFPELHKSGLTKKAQADIDKAKVGWLPSIANKLRYVIDTMDASSDVAAEMYGLPDIAPSGISPQKQLDALNQLGPILDQQLADGTMTADQWQKAIDAIKKGKTAEERLEKAKKAVPEIANQVLQEMTQPPARLPRSLAGQEAGLPGSDRPGAGMTDIPSPEEPLLGEGEEYDMAPVEGPEQFMESTPEQMSRIPGDKYAALDMKMFNRLPAREDIGKVPGRFRKASGTRGRYS